MKDSPVAARAVVLDSSRQMSERLVEVADVPSSGGWMSVEACGMCGSDWNWYANRPIPSPMILGHEIVGTVTSLWGELADRGDVAVGDRIVVEEAISCHACALCRSGRHRVCQQSSRYGGSPISTSPGLWGGFAETVHLDRRAVAHHVPAGLASPTATLFVPLSNGISWISVAGNLRPGETVVVLGPGQHGLASAVAARRLGARQVVVAGRARDASRLEAARALGADLTIDVDSVSLTETVLDLTSGAGADLIVDTTPASTTALSDAVSMAAIGGRIVVAGNKGGAMSPLDTDTLFRREITVRGVAARESWAIDLALEWLASSPESFAPFGGTAVGLSSVEDVLLALGGQPGVEPPLHPVIVPSRSPHGNRGES